MITFETTINGDPIYQGKPMIATFDLTVGNPPFEFPFDKTILFYGVPAAMIIPAGLAIYQPSSHFAEFATYPHV